jgi:D-3-phosphoglycerate dehydrogenase
MAAAPIPPTARHTVRILLADTFPDAHRERLEQMGHTVTYRPDLTGDTLPADLDGHEILVVRSTRVTAEAVTATQTLTLIIRAGREPTRSTSRRPPIGASSCATPPVGTPSPLPS